MSDARRSGEGQIIMENELVVPGTALDDRGNVAEAGWARSWVRSFNRERSRSKSG